MFNRDLPTDLPTPNPSIEREGIAALRAILTKTKPKHQAHRDAAIHAYWREYNQTSLLSKQVAVTEGKYTFPVKSYTHYFMEKLKFKKWLTGLKHYRQFGASSAAWLLEKCRGFNIKAYDYDEVTITVLNARKEKGFEAVCMDMNRFHEHHDRLKADLSAPSAILLIRILEYLKPEAQLLFLTYLVAAAEPKSIFVVAHAVDRHDTSERMGFLAENYCVGFFQPHQTEVLVHDFTKPNESGHCDEMWVVRKRR